MDLPREGQHTMHQSDGDQAQDQEDHLLQMALRGPGGGVSGGGPAASAGMGRSRTQ